jgi:CubicO group peptidase (beta-lactamase class C family)
MYAALKLRRMVQSKTRVDLMKIRFELGLLVVVLLFFSTFSVAQSQRRATVQREPARVVEQSSASLSEALNDPSVQAELRAHVRRVDTSARAARIDRRALEPLREGQSDDQPERSSRRISSAELASLARLNPGTPRPSRELSASSTVSSTAAGVESRVTDAIRSRVARALPPSGIGEIAAPPTPYLDVNGFGDDLHAALQNSVTGYEMRMRRNGQTIYTLQWNWAQTPSDSGLAWSQNRRMHVASISKFVTAMALTRLLDSRGIDYNTPIISYLPDYWQTGSNIGGITFAHLMNHRSGIVTGTNSDASFSRMKSLIAAGVSNPGQSSGYSNVNFALCRILIATIAGYIDTSANFGPNNDLMWDWITVSAYSDYVRDNVFSPAGVSGPSFANSANSARAYRWNDNGSGWDSGNMMGQAGGAAWHITPDELLDVVGEFRRGGGIVSPSRALEILNASYGLNSAVNGNSSPAGRFYYKPGKWTRNGQTEQALVMVLPEQIEVVIFVNSAIGPNDVSLQTLGRTLYTNNIIEP